MRAIDADAFDERVRAAGGMSEEELTEDFKDGVQAVLYMLSNQPTIHPEIIRCRECKFASGDSRICMKFGHSPIGELDFCSFAERREENNESN